MKQTGIHIYIYICGYATWSIPVAPPLDGWDLYSPFKLLESYKVNYIKSWNCKRAIVRNHLWIYHSPLLCDSFHRISHKCIKRWLHNWKSKSYIQQISSSHSHWAQPLPGPKPLQHSECSLEECALPDWSYRRKALLILQQPEKYCTNHTCLWSSWWIFCWNRYVSVFVKQWKALFSTTT